MSVKPDGAPLPGSDVAAQRRWLITIMITVLFGGFGAVMAYLTYADRQDSPRSPASSPTSRPTTEPATPAPASDDKGKGHKDK